VPDPEPTRDPAREEGERAASEQATPAEADDAYDDDVVARETSAAAAAAGRIGGSRASEGPAVEGLDEAERPLAEAGEGEAEGFELAEQELIEHASHGDLHAARRTIEDAPLEPDDARAAEGGEADFERSSEQEDEFG
jgi:hypothetical protein